MKVEIKPLDLKHDDSLPVLLMTIQDKLNEVIEELNRTVIFTIDPGYSTIVNLDLSEEE